MTTARTLVRFVFAGLFINAMAVACVVSDGGDNTDDNTACDPGTYKDCTCTTTGNDGQKKCSASGNGYGACVCDGVGVGGSGSAGEPSTTAGTTSNTYGGETSTVGGAGGENTGGMMSEGGAGGAAAADDVCVIDEEDDCQSCVQVDCCEAWTACRADQTGDCESEVLDIKACSQIEKRGVDDEVTPAELEDCAKTVAGTAVWSTGVLPTTKAVIDCVAGGQGWAAKNTLAGSTCNSLCFAAE